MLRAFDYIQDDYHQLRHPEIIGDPDLFQAWAFYAWGKYINPTSPKNVLEIGGAFGWNLAYAIEVGLECEMIEPSTTGRKSAESLGIKSYDDAKNVPTKDYDLVLMRHVLEHVQDPAFMLEHIQRFLHSKARLTIVLPIEKSTLMPDPTDMNHHLYCWNPQTIQNLLHSTGYSVLHISFNYMTGRKLLLPVWRSGRKDLYVRLLGLVGRIFNARELIIVATPSRDT